ncbi:MAG: prolyl oligopeptidase family serine peptidase [Deltaproteobacteria bacterium]|nr:prolyl oligopeptidase family serine peptidase [Deltaproteobacteria bacterium]
MGELPKPRLTSVLRAEGYSYLLYVPEECGGEGSWPLLLFLHGVGERGNELEKVAVHGVPKQIEEGVALPFVVVSPQCPAGRFWDNALLIRLLDEVNSSGRIDADRVYVTGLSMGGYATWSLAGEQPWRFAAAAPVCGGGDPRRVGRLRRVPVWAFHGAKDPVVPVSASRRMVEALLRCGGDARLTIYPDAGHDCWTETYANPELYEWLLAHRRRPLREAPCSGP